MVRNSWFINNYSYPWFKGFYLFHKAIDYTRKEERLNDFVSYLIKPLDSASHFCDHCEVMSHIIRKFNDTSYHLESEIKACRKKKALESVNIKLNSQIIALQNKMSYISNQPPKCPNT